jgi:predicted sugar kinase
MRWIADAAGDPEGPQGGAAIGQSSWGPTGFAILPSQARAEAVLAAAQEAGQMDERLTLRIVSGRNHPALVREAASRPIND